MQAKSGCATAVPRPLLPGCERIPFGDLAALKTQLDTRRPAAFLVEPIQCEAGVVMPPAGFIFAEGRSCACRAGTILILDEVQTGLGPHRDDVRLPGGGIRPRCAGAGQGGKERFAWRSINATLTWPELYTKAYGATDRFDLHGFDVWRQCAYRAWRCLETLHILAEEDMIANSKARGAELLAGLRERLACHPLVRAVRGRGLLVGVELGPTDKGWLNRLSPALVETISKRAFGQWRWHYGCWKPRYHLSAGLAVVERVETGAAADGQLGACATDDRDAGRGAGRISHGVTRIVRDVTERLLRQFLAGWKF